MFVKSEFPLVVEQIRGPIVQIVIQAPNLARMFFGGYWSNLPDGPLENPRWQPIFSRWPPFSLYKIVLKIKCICLRDFSDLNVMVYILAPSLIHCSTYRVCIVRFCCPFLHSVSIFLVLSLIDC